MNIENAKVLIVGAGGIGCELLKNVVLSGFSSIHLVDLDTIELSNLNRQFLFRRKHIGQSKAEVAREAALNMNPKVSITAHFANITDIQKFPIPFFKQFDLVMNALDNLAARRYVNLMCLMVQVPLIESGTAGYLGQTSIIIGRKTECFDCIPKEIPKTYPVCTIRSNPSTFIHCVIWAKEFLLPNLFGNNNSETESNSFNSESNDEKLKETWNSEQLAFSMLKELKTEPKMYYEKLFKKIFIEDVEKIRGIEELWKDRSVPIPITSELANFGDEFDFNLNLDLDLETCCLNDHEIWDISLWIKLFKSSIKRLLHRSFDGEIIFDKDDTDTLDLVASSSNIRAHIFGIKLENKFEIKALAGNIIPAIATTNAIAAGMMIIHAKSIINDGDEGCSYCNAYIKYGNCRKAFTIEKSCLPNPDCSICSTDRGLLSIDCDKFTIKELLAYVIKIYVESLKEKFSSIDVEIDEEYLVLTEGNRLIYDYFDENGNSSKILKSLGISDSKLIKISFNERTSLLLGIIQNETTSLELNLVSPKTLIEGPEREEESEEDELFCCFEEDDSVEIVEKDIKKAKIEL